VTKTTKDCCDTNKDVTARKHAAFLKADITMSHSSLRQPGARLQVCGPADGTRSTWHPPARMGKEFAETMLRAISNVVFAYCGRY
jgi:hypothetical protein